ncbi:unnamed protein product [Spirodela intermedia]|uniref:Uncharacterized protein n=1 Tax=Spirodela intermedia TaxID=51605 RepID=A0A7I8JIN1_SPIIN|nr:unnamed protein product [Spirodela intermedia]CAA6669625.1 unnamed protein product [Spirodela intermedia]
MIGGGARPGAGPVRAVGHPDGLWKLHAFDGLAVGELPLPLHGLHLLTGVEGVRSTADRVGEAVYPHLELVVFPLHPPPVPDEVRPDLVLVGVPLQVEVALRVPGLDGVLTAEGDPDVGEARRLRHRLEGQESAAVIGDVAGELLHGIVGGEGGSFSGSAVETKMSIPGRSDLPEEDFSNLSLSTVRSAARFTGQSLGSWSSSHEKANQISQTTDIPHSQTASSLTCLIRHARNSPRTTIRANIRSLHAARERRERERERENEEEYRRALGLPVRAEDGSGDLQLAGQRSPWFLHKFRVMGAVAAIAAAAVLRRPEGVTIAVGLSTSPWTAGGPSSTPSPAVEGAAASARRRHRSPSRRRRGVVVAFGAYLVAALAGDDVGAALVPHDLAVAADGGADGPPGSGHLRMARLGVDHLLHQVGAGVTVEAMVGSTGTSPAIGWLSGVGGMSTRYLAYSPLSGSESICSWS